jgi:hypothetical protein
VSGFQFNQDWAFKIAFQRTDDPEPIGVLDFSGSEMTFSGRADESAKTFFDAVIKNQVGWNKHLEDVRRELAAAQKQRDEAVRDAERYKWLKSGKCYWVEIQSQPDGDYIFMGQPAHSLGGCIDNSIDAMLAAMRKEGGGA